MHLEITGESCYLTPYQLACAKIEALRRMDFQGTDLKHSKFICVSIYT